MSFFRSATKVLAYGTGTAGLTGIWAGAICGAQAAGDERIRFPRNLNVIAKGGLFGAGKALQYTALPITYPLAKHLESKGYTESFLQKRLMDLVDDAASKTARAEYETLRQIKRK